MMSQDIFNKQQKSFMNYEPVKIPNQRQSNSQITSQTQTKGPFVSDVKIIGDNVTKKDYDTFFEGFNSVNRSPLLTAKKPSWQNTTKTQSTPSVSSVNREQTMQKLPYIPSVHGVPEIQNFPNKPLKEGDLKPSLYSEKTPAYAQENNTYQKSGETARNKSKEDFLKNIYVAKTIATANNPLTGLLRAAVGRTLENHVQEKHYSRNEHNVDLPENRDEAIEREWKTEIANCHQFTAKDGKDYIKYVSPDGKREVIFDDTGKIVISADEDIGTYNYADPDLWLEHFFADILPWIRFGNTPEDTTEWYERIGGSLFGGKKSS